MQSESQSKLVSIIIPVFNAARYIEPCLRSLLSQSHQTIEVVLVDDASVDDSCSIIRSLVSGDERFKLYPQLENRGASSCRNIGLQHANGNYILFVDADDWLESNTVELLIDLAEQEHADWVCASHIQNLDSSQRNKPDGTPDEDHVFNQSNLVVYVRQYISKPYLFTLFVHCWGKLYRRNLIDNYDLKFDENLSQLEDVHFNFRYMQLCQKIAYKNAHLYHHRISQLAQSMSTKTGTESDAIIKTLNAFEPVRDFLLHLNKESTLNVDKEVGHLFITTIIITLIRLSRRFLRAPSMDTFNQIRLIARSKEVSDRLSSYTISRNESKLLLLALRTRISLFVLLAGVLRACVIALTKK
jgi:glycosyltransferase involved in cell wall biosynthesis